MTEDFRPIDLEEAFGKWREAIHASHILLWTKDNSGDNEVIFGLMQMRSDGRIGFPGGRSDEKVVDQNEIVSALYRELKEEIDFIPSENEITLSNRISTHMKGRKVLHFFAKELSLSSFQKIERNHMNARDFPKESVGLFRIPLSVVGHNTYIPFRKFFANFGENVFAGIARNQLIDTVIQLNLIGERDVQYLKEVMSL